jgi:hypothetical protein
MTTFPFHIMHYNNSIKEVGCNLQERIKNHKSNMNPLENNHSNLDSYSENLKKIKNP